MKNSRLVICLNKQKLFPHLAIFFLFLCLFQEKEVIIFFKSAKETANLNK